MDLEGSLLDGYISVGAVAITLASGLLQGLLLCCFPNYRHFCVAELVKPRFSMDAAAFPQIYQRDDGGHLHLGVLLPGFSERDNLSMTVRAQLRTPRSFLSAVPLASGEARRPKETGGQPGTCGFSPPALPGFLFPSPGRFR